MIIIIYIFIFARRKVVGKGKDMTLLKRMYCIRMSGFHTSVKFHIKFGNHIRFHLFYLTSKNLKNKCKGCLINENTYCPLNIACIFFHVQQTSEHFNANVHWSKGYNLGTIAVGNKLLITEK